MAYRAQEGQRSKWTGYGLVGVVFNAALVWLAGTAPAAAAADAIRILALGDSLVAGWGLSENDAFPAQLSRALAAQGYNVDIIDAGVSGDTSAGGRARLEWLLAGTPADAVIVELGANDGLRGVDPAETRANLDAILTELDRRGLPTLFTGMLAPPNLGPAYGREFAQVYRDLADKHDVVFYPFFLEGVAARPALNQGDGIHPNAEGVQVIVERILPAVRTLIERTRARSAAADAEGER